MTESKAIKIPIEYSYHRDFMSRYANNVVIQHTEDEFIISFFEVLPPLLLGSPESQAAQAAELESVKADCVARIIVPEKMMPNIIKVLQENLDKHHSKYSKQSEEENE